MNPILELHRTTCLYLLEQADKHELAGGVPERIRLKADRILSTEDLQTAQELAAKARQSIDIHLIAMQVPGGSAPREHLLERALIADRAATDLEHQGDTRGAKSRRKEAEKLRSKVLKMKG